MNVYRTGLATATRLYEGRVYICGGGSGDDANTREDLTSLRLGHARRRRVPRGSAV